MSDNKQNSGEPIVTDRHRSRELALRTLYAFEVDTNGSWQDMLDSIAENDQLSVKVRKYASELVRATVEHLDSIDPMIAAKAANWELRRMAAVDRNTLRLATAELIYFRESVPYRVVIDEAVEIAKAYGTDDSGKFVNGILDSIRKDLYRKDGKGSGKEEKKEPANS
ncbi:MAG: transcription antitermination factor NusB [Chitinispirillia bacterium]|nr:transcription antitermination factor NusB [Chitinispirillia bacterium]MCL2267600.1 transcription antitermination factor NusB [Chitinispirillia bacterium]